MPGQATGSRAASLAAFRSSGTNQPFLLHGIKPRKKWANLRCIYFCAFLTYVLSALPQLRDSQSLHGVLGFLAANNPSGPRHDWQGPSSKQCRGQLIILQPTLLHHTRQLLSAQDSCILPVWSEMSVFANATRLTSLTMSRHFEETTQSLIKNSDSVSYAQPFSLPFHQNLSLPFWNVSCRKKKKKESVWNRMKNCCSLGLSESLEKGCCSWIQTKT